MRPRDANIFGVFIGILTAVGVYLLIDSFADLSLGVEYVIIIITTVLFSTIGITIGRRMRKNSPTPPLQPPASNDNSNPANTPRNP